MHRGGPAERNETMPSLTGAGAVWATTPMVAASVNAVQSSTCAARLPMRRIIGLFSLVRSALMRLFK
jgi:hypothetical protein